MKAFASACARALDALRLRRPHVHVLTNLAAAQLTPNMVLAVGGRPSITALPRQIAEFIARSDALLINMGTWDEARAQAAPIAIATAQQRGLRWVLDPVKVDMSQERCAEARGFLAQGPAILRGNRGEIAALLQADSHEALMREARSRSLTLAITGETDWVSDGRRVMELHNGHRLMDAVTAMGCAGTAIIAAMTAVEPDPFLAAAYGLAVLGVAGEMAGERAAGPGSFQPLMLDNLYTLTEQHLLSRLKGHMHG